MTVFALGMPVVFGLAGVAFDYATYSSQRTKMQNVADAAALATTRELQIGAPSQARIQAVAETIVAAQFELGRGDGPVQTTAVALYIPPAGAPAPDASAKDKPPNSVKVTITQRKNAIMSGLVTPELTDLAVQSTAQLAGGTKLCVIGLEEAAPNTISVKNQALLSAPGCSVYANSRDPNAISAQANAKITSLLTCSAGGYAGMSKNYAPRAPLTDCPKQQDPLASRPAPPVGPCLKTNFKVQTLPLGLLAVPLDPGTYCGGLSVEPGAVANLRPGIYVIKDGPLVVGQPLLGLLPATLRGTNVGFYFTGTVAPDKSGAVLPMHFQKNSVVELTAPKTGPMAGLLLHEDRTSTANRLFDISSDTAKKLVGTIYIPRGIFSVTANQTVADQSEYTAIVARRIELDKSPNLVLNTRYADTDVPVPEGLGPNSGAGRLVQ